MTHADNLKRHQKSCCFTINDSESSFGYGDLMKSVFEYTFSVTGGSASGGSELSYDEIYLVIKL